MSIRSIKSIHSIQLKVKNNFSTSELMLNKFRRCKHIVLGNKEYAQCDKIMMMHAEIDIIEMGILYTKGLCVFPSYQKVVRGKRKVAKT